MTQTDSIRRKVRAELAYREISGRQLCTLIGMSQSALAARLSGHVEFRISELQTIADAIEVPLSRFLPDTQPQPAGGGQRG